MSEQIQLTKQDVNLIWEENIEQIQNDNNELFEPLAPLELKENMPRLD